MEEKEIIKMKIKQNQFDSSPRLNCFKNNRYLQGESGQCSVLSLAIEKDDSKTHIIIAQ